METIEIKNNESLFIARDFIVHKKGTFDEQKSPIDNLLKISIFTRDTGPMFDDVALVLFFTEMNLILPSEHKSYGKLYDSLSKIFTLDYEKVIAAMCCAYNAEFVIWTK